MDNGAGKGWVDRSGRVWRGVDRSGRVWRGVDWFRRVWRGVEGSGVV